MRQARWIPFAMLIVIGAAWGATQPLSKVAVSDGYRHFGILFWQSLVGALALVAVCLAQRKPLPVAPVHLTLYLIIALIGTVLPGIASYSAAIHLPSGVLSILLSSVPMLAFPIALAFGLEPFRLVRFGGLILGLVGIAILVVPDTGLPAGVPAIWIAVALIASLFYAFEGNYVARWGTAGLNPIQVLAGALSVSALVTLPLSILTGQFIDPRGPWAGPDFAIIAAAFLHAFAYSGYVWLVGRTGPVFAVQVSYTVTFFGVIWAMVFLGEGYSVWFWLACAVLMLGVALVQPRPSGLVTGPDAGQDARV